MNALIIKLVVVAALLFGGWRVYENHNEMVGLIAQQKLTIDQMEKNHGEYKRAKENQIDRLKEEVFQSKKATSEMMKLYTDTLNKYEKNKKELDEKAANLDKLIDDYGLYDPFKAMPYARSYSDNGRQGTVEKTDFTLTTSNNNQASNGRLSTGLIQYLNTRFKQADQVVLQLKTVQDYTIGQHKWILDNCNAEEIK